MVGGKGLNRPWHDCSARNQSVQSHPGELFDGLSSRPHDQMALMRAHHDERKLPPISDTVYHALRVPLSPRSIMQQPPPDVAGALAPPSRSPAPSSTSPHSHLRSEQFDKLPLLRRLSLPQCANEHGPEQYDHHSSSLERTSTQPARPYHPSNSFLAPTKAHLSSADIPETTRVGKSESDWTAEQIRRPFKDVDMRAGLDSVLDQLTRRKLYNLVGFIVVELDALNKRLDEAWDPLEGLTKAPYVERVGLYQSLEWVHDIISQRRRLYDARPVPPTAETDEGMRRRSSTVPSPSSILATKRKVESPDRERNHALKRTCPSTCNDRSQAPDWARDFTSKGSYRTQSLMCEALPTSLAKTPLHAASNMLLPSPTSFKFSVPNVAAPLSPGGDAVQSAQAAHLQDLQHQVSTKTLALQTLQREHDNLLAAFSRSQIRCTTLEKKFQVSDAEINTLTEERLKLLSQIEAFETQVEDLMSSREEARKQSVANGGQYMKIMAMASRLEAQGAADKKKSMSEKEEWDREKHEYCRQIDILQNRRDKLVDTTRTTITARGPLTACSGVQPQLRCFASCCTPSTHLTLDCNAQGLETDAVLKSTSVATLRTEIVLLREKCSNMEAVLEDLNSERERMDRVVREVDDITHRIATIASVGARSCNRPSGSSGQHSQEKGHVDDSKMVEESGSAVQEVVSSADSL